MLAIEEKPADPKTDFAVTGAYMYSSDVFSVIKTLTPSGRGELEITDVNNHYIKTGSMRWSECVGEWTDAGTFASLHHANKMVRDLPIPEVLAPIMARDCRSYP